MMFSTVSNYTASTLKGRSHRAHLHSKQPGGEHQHELTQGSMENLDTQ